MLKVIIEIIVLVFHDNNFFFGFLIFVSFLFGLIGFGV